MLKEDDPTDSPWFLVRSVQDAPVANGDRQDVLKGRGAGEGEMMYGDTPNQVLPPKRRMMHGLPEMERARLVKVLIAAARQSKGGFWRYQGWLALQFVSLYTLGGLQKFNS